MLDAYIYKALKLTEHELDSYKNHGQQKLEWLKGLSKVNIFVGANNSGKSRFLRFLTKQLTQEKEAKSLVFDGYYKTGGTHDRFFKAVQGIYTNAIGDLKGRGFG